VPGIGHIQRHDYSYGVYIYHWPVILVLRTMLPPTGALRLTALAIVVTLVLAALSWHLVEAPVLRLVHGWLRRSRGAPASAAKSSDAAKKPHSAAGIDADSA
jgi:peptidoglycan/LPS O-acetylase OafA/YrhL